MTVQDIIYGQGAIPSTAFGGIYARLANRADIVQKPAMAASWVYKTVLELTSNYAFQALQKTGPIVSLIAGQNEYDYSFFLNSGTSIPNLIPSFYMWYDSAKTSGIGLKFKSIDSLEQMLSTEGTPAYWSRFANKFYVAPTPTQSQFARVRYQYQHPFSNPVSLTDPILMPDDWLDILELAASERGAADLRMLDYATQYHTMLFGDPDFERSSGATGMPGLIFRRVSQYENDNISQMRSIRVRR